MEKEINKIKIRKMTEEDILKIDSNFIEQGWGTRLQVLKEYLVEQQRGQRVVLVAEMTGDVAGYVTLMKLAKNGPYKNVHPEVADFNVFEKYQQLGIGNKLLDGIEEEAKVFSTVITLGVGLHKGYGAAQRIYIKRGYIPDGSGVWYNNENLEMNEPCFNNDDLAIYLAKEIG